MKFIFLLFSILFYISCAPPYFPALHLAVEEDDLNRVKELAGAKKCSLDEFKVLYDSYKKTYNEYKSYSFFSNDEEPSYTSTDLMILNGECFDVNLRGLLFGETALFYVKSLKMLEYLIAQEADVNAKSHSGNTPLHFAETPAVAKVLLDHGADVNAKSHSGNTPLHFAETPAVAKVLLDHGADVNAKSHSGNTPLHFAETPAVAKVLLDHGADVNAKNYYNGGTPLHFAETPAVAKVLLDHGADIEKNNRDGNSPIVMAVLYEKYDLAEFLFKRGANPHAKMFGTLSALDIAEERSLNKLIRLFKTYKTYPDPNKKEHLEASP